MIATLSNAYDRLVLGHPKAVLILLFGLLVFFSYHARNFQLDASADSLLLEDDKDLELYRAVSKRYPTQELLIVTFTPVADLFSKLSLDNLKKLRDEIQQIPGVDSIVSILDVPLLKSSDVPLTELADNIQTLESPKVDPQQAKRELLESPLYSDLLISAEADTTALFISLKDDPDLKRLLNARYELRLKRRTASLSDAERNTLEQTEGDYQRAQTFRNQQIHEEILAIRAIMATYQHTGVVPGWGADDCR